MKKCAVIVDVSSCLHRFYNAFPHLSNSQHISTSAVFGFLSFLLKFLSQYHADYLVICFDYPGKKMRHEIYPEYKANRPTISQNLVDQIQLTKQLVLSMGIQYFERSKYEADDCIATAHRLLYSTCSHIIIITHDKDMFQLIDSKTQIYNHSKKIFYDTQKIKQELNVFPSQIVDFLSIIGDYADNIPGVYGIGPKGAEILLKEYTSIENMMSRIKFIPSKFSKKLVSSQDMLLMNKKLITLDAFVPCDFDTNSYALSYPLPQSFHSFLLKQDFFSLVRLAHSLGFLPKEEKKRMNDLDISSHMCILTAEWDIRTLVDHLTISKSCYILFQPSLYDDTLIRCFLLSTDGKEIFCIPIQTSCDVGLSLQVVLSFLKVVFENPNVKKIGFSLKQIMYLLLEYHISIIGPLYDLMFAEYYMNSAVLKFKLNEMIYKYFNVQLSIDLHSDEASIAQYDEYMTYYMVQMDFLFNQKIKNLPCSDFYFNTEQKLISILFKMEQIGITVDRDYLLTLDRNFDDSIRKSQDEIYTFSNFTFNINSTKQLSSILYEQLNLPNGKYGKLNSTNEKQLSYLATLHPFPSLILKYRELFKLYSTYVQPFLKISNQTNVIHTTFNQIGTVTGRLSSSKPNLQNVPVCKNDKFSIRRCFVPRQGYVFLSLDYSQIDLRILAHFSKDSILCSSFLKGEDIHCRTAAEIFNIPIEQVDQQQKRKAKSVNFGIIYGQQAFGLSSLLNISISEAKNIIEKYFRRYKGAYDWIQNVKKQVAQDGFSSTLYGLRRYVPDIYSHNKHIRSFAERVAINTPIQGTASEVIKRSMVRIFSDLSFELKNEDLFVVLQVHDELLVEVRISQLQTISQALKKIMEYNDILSIPLVVHLKSGKSWGNLQTLHV